MISVFDHLSNFSFEFLSKRFLFKLKSSSITNKPDATLLPKINIYTLGDTAAKEGRNIVGK